jgi:hypothetical protein
MDEDGIQLDGEVEAGEPEVQAKSLWMSESTR